MPETEFDLPDWKPPAVIAPAAAPPSGITPAAVGDRPTLTVPRRDMTEQDLPAWTPEIAAAAGKKPFGWGDTWPVQLAKQVWSGITAPGDVATGKVGVVQPATPGVWTEEDEFRQQQADADLFHRTMDLAQLGVRPSAGVKVAPAGEVTSTAGQRAALTADELLHAPLPKGVVSDSPIVQSVTAKSQSFPISGSRVAGKVAKTQEAAGEHVSGIAEEMAQGTGSRATAGPLIEQGLQDVVERNKSSQNLGYDRLRALLPHQGEAEIHSMPRTRVVLDKIAEERRKAGWPNPEQGLENFRNLQDFASFNGAQRARSEAFQPSMATRSNPGFHGGDYKRIYGAMSQDLRDMAASGAAAQGQNPRSAVAAFEAADSHFARLAEENEMVDKLLKSGGESALGQLIGKARGKGGDFQTLAKLRQSMPPEKFAQIGGTALGEMGREGGEFSLRKFTTAWNKMSDQAKSSLFSPNHLRDINDIANMGDFIKKSLKDTNVSHTAGSLLIFEVAKTIGELGAAMGAGLLTTGELTKAAAAGGVPFAVGWMLGNPARAASIRAYIASRAGLSTQPSAARVATFNIAVRNLAHTLNLPVEQVQKIAGQPPTSSVAEQRPQGKTDRILVKQQ